MKKIINNKHFAILFNYDETTKRAKLVVLPVLRSSKYKSRFAVDFSTVGGAHTETIDNIDNEDELVARLNAKLNSSKLINSKDDRDVKFFQWEGNIIYTIVRVHDYSKSREDFDYGYNVVTSGNDGHYIYTNMYYCVDEYNGSMYVSTKEVIENTEYDLTVLEVTQ